KPATLRTCALLFKPEALQCQLDLDYIGFKLGKEFVVGYGLDYAGRYRQLPYIGALESEH
ncbi:MAG TPA: hypoxanthine phosphoribosyltransferase, partial [Oligoflexia bacterium]|nr:hypoxanthine phosphoribosyltransferase [Oligoflexia bacterium]